MKIHYRHDYTPSHYEILSCSLLFDIKEEETFVTNEMCIVQQGENPSPLVLNGEAQRLISVSVNGEILEETAYTLTETELILNALPAEFTLCIVSANQPHKNTQLEGLFASKNMLCTQCEPHGFRRITFYLDRPDVMSFFTTKIIADKKRYPVLLSNGNLLETGDIDATHHYAIWEDPFKKPCYLFALVAGNLAKLSDHFITQSGRRVTLEIFSDASMIDQCHYALEALKESMHWDEQRFGREYDLDIYMIVASEDFNMGAMENKGLNIFNTKYVLADPKYSTDLDYQNVQAVIGHEYFHNWTGNRVTCRDWFQLSLKEGLTVFRDAEFTADHHHRTLKRIQDASLMRSAQFAEDAGPMAHPIRPDSYVEMNNFYTLTVYEKGAEVIRMMHTLLGETGFRRGMDLYFERFDGKAVTCDDFVAAMADANDFDFSLFKNWYSTAGTPEVSVKTHYDAAQKTFHLQFKQSGHFHIPIRLGLIAQDGRALCFNEGINELVYSLKDSTAELLLTGVEEAPIPSLLRDFSAPVKLFYEYSYADLSTLWLHDANLFNRWDAGSRLMTALTLDLYHGKALSDAALIAYVAEPMIHILAEAEHAPGLVAELIAVPTIKSMAELISSLDPQKLIAAREHLLMTIAKHLQGALKATYVLAKTAEPKDAKVAPYYRMLQNTCLAYLTAMQEYSEAEAAYTTATHMTTRLGALSAIVNSDAGTLKNELLADFFSRYHDQPLMVDKWFAVQASSKASGTLEQVQALVKHPAFIRTNPNKVYSLVLGLAQNFYAFHAKDGAGYAFLAQFIAELDGINALVAARLVRQMISFKHYSEPYQSLMQAALRSLAATPKLSNDVGEIVSKALGDATP
jgi:aminopeptidase N